MNAESEARKVLDLIRECYHKLPKKEHLKFLRLVYTLSS